MRRWWSATWTPISLPSYIKNEYQKLDIYKRISAMENEEEYLDMQDELIDRFGDIPGPWKTCWRWRLIKGMAHWAYVTEVAINRQEVRLTMFQKARIDTAGIPALVQAYQGAVTFQMTEQPYFLYVDRKVKHKDCGDMMETAKELLQKIGELAER